MLKVITMTAYRRPEYTRQVLEALARCEGIADWVFLPNVEPGHADVIEQFRMFNACETKLEINGHKLGLNRNTYACVTRANECKADCIVHFEDDTVPSPDALRFFEWAICEVVSKDTKSNDGHHISFACGYNKPLVQPTESQSFACDSRPIFNCWGWGVDRSRLRWMITQWCFQDPNRFTTPFRKGFKKTRREIFPILSRIQNIGVEHGSNDTIKGRRLHRTPWVAVEQLSSYSFSIRS